MEIAHGEINIGLKSDVEPELRRVEAEYKAAMARIDRMEATAKIKADTENLDRQIKEAKDRVRQLEGERATVKVKADKKELDVALKEARAQVKELDGKKATIEIETRGAETALAKIDAIRKAEAARATAEARYAKARNTSATDASQLARKAEVDAARQRVEIDRLTSSWIAQSKVVEQMRRARPPTLGKEAKAEFEHFKSEAENALNFTESRLKQLGQRVPPLHMKVDDSFLARAKFAVQDFVNNAQQKLGTIGHARLSLGPFSGTLRTMGLAISALAPIITSLLGSATALVGVLGTGLAGAASIAGGTVAGLGLNLIGVLGAVKPAINDFKMAEKATTAYKTAVDKYGASSKQAKTAQAQMNQVLKSVDPTARQAAKGWANLSSEWHKLTGPAAKKALGDVLVGGIKTLNALMPTLAHNTNQTFSILDTKLTGIESKLRTPGAIRIFDSLGRSANTFLGPAIDGLTHLGAAFGHVAESAARLFAGPAGTGFSKWAAQIDQATQPGAKLDGTIQRLGNHAADLLHFFSALGKLLVTVFNGGANSGDRMVKSMTAALNRWNQFLHTTRGRSDMASFFNRSEGAVRALWSALAPLIAAFVQWSNLLAPFTTGLLKGVSFIARLVGGFTKLIGLGGPLTALGATIGAVFAVSKLGSFLSMLIRIGATMKELGAIGSLKALFSGNFKSLMGTGAGASAEATAIREAHAQGAAEVATAIREAHATGGAEAATEIRAGEAEGGAVAATEERAGMVEGGAVGGAAGGARGLLGRLGIGAAAGEEIGAVGAGATEATAGVAGLGVALGGITLGLGVAAGAAYGLYKAFGQTKTAGEQAIQTMNQATKTSGTATHQYNQLRGGISDVGSAYAHTRLNVEQAKKVLDSTKKGTIEHTQAELDYRDALRANIAARNQWIDQSHKLQASANTEATSAQHALDQNKRAIASIKAEIAADPTGAKAKLLGPVLKQLEGEQGRLASTAASAWNRVAAAPDNAARAYRGMIELTGSAEQAVGRLARAAGGAPIAKKISLKFDSPSQVQKVASQAQSALGAGVSQRVVMKIIADSSNADQAIRRLNAEPVREKRLLLRAADQASTVIRKVLGLPLPDRVIRLVGNAAGAVAATVRAASAIRGVPGSHNTNINANPHDAIAGAGQAAGAIRGVPGSHNTNISASGNVVTAAHAAADALNAIPRNIQAAVNATVTIATHHTGHATGGPVTVAEKQATAAALEAQRRTTQRTTGGRYTAPTFLVGEEKRPEYVIATNPAYRDKNRDYLQMAAGDLGMVVVEAAAGGRHPAHAAAKKKPHKDTPSRGGRGAPTGAPRPHLDYVSTDSATADYISQFRQDSDKNLNDAYDKIKNDTNRINALVKSWHRAKTGTSQRNIASKIRTTRTDLQSTQHRLGHLRDLDNLARAWYGESSDLENRIASDTSKMNADAKFYNATGDQTRLGDWNTVKGDREAALRQLRDLYALVKGAAPPQFQSDLQKGYDAADSDLADSQFEAPPTVTVAAAPTLDDVLAKFGLTGTLADLNKAYALSQVNDVADNPATPYVDEHAASLSDNASAAKALTDFYSGVLNQAQATGQPADVITEAANAYVSARDTYTGITDTITGAATAAAANQANDQINYTSARADLFSQMGSNFAPIWSQPGPVPVGFGASGYGGAGQQNAVMPNTTQVSVVNNFDAPPPDPHTWSNSLSWELQAAV